MNIMQWLIVFAGGGIGSMLRYALGIIATNQKHFYLGTLCANLIAAFMIGMFYQQYQLDPARAWFRLFFITGVCGGLSTFSTLSQENLILIQESRWTELLLYSLFSLVTGVLLVWAGYRAGQWWAA